MKTAEIGTLVVLAFMLYGVLVYLPNSLKNDPNLLK
jgi:hypothetical protein